MASTRPEEPVERGLRLISHLALAVSAVLAAGCEQHVVQEPPAPSIPPVSATVVHRQSYFMYPVTYYGRVEPARRTSLSFEFAGRLQQVLVDEGEFVQAGDIVARLDTSLLEVERDVLLARRKTEFALLSRLHHGERAEVIAASRAEVKLREAELRRAAADKLRAEKVYAGRSISRSDYDQAVYSHEAAVFSLEQARQQLEELESGSRNEDIDAQENRVAMIDAEIELLNVRFAKSSLVAPFDGICIRRLQDEGVTLSPGQIVFEVNEANQLEARFSVPQPHLNAALQSRYLNVDGDQHMIGEARTVSQVDDTTRTVSIIIPLHVDGDDHILPGQTCTLQIENRVDTECVVVPISALVASIRGLWSCYRLLPNPADPLTYTVERVDVSIIHSDGVRVFLSSTLPNQSLIIDRGVHKIVPGMQVRIVDDP